MAAVSYTAMLEKAQNQAATGEILAVGEFMGARRNLSVALATFPERAEDIGAAAIIKVFNESLEGCIEGREAPPLTAHLFTRIYESLEGIGIALPTTADECKVVKSVIFAMFRKIQRENRFFAQSLKRHQERLVREVKRHKTNAEHALNEGTATLFICQNPRNWKEDSRDRHSNTWNEVATRIDGHKKSYFASIEQLRDLEKLAGFEPAEVVSGDFSQEVTWGLPMKMEELKRSVQRAKGARHREVLEAIQSKWQEFKASTIII